MNAATVAPFLMIFGLFGSFALSIFIAEFVVARVLRRAREERDRAARVDATISELDRRLAVMRGRAFGRMKGKDDE
jgi:hypothetical protein